jgi:[ribosomal protein S5]-alanine N-acetyltransferase
VPLSAPQVIESEHLLIRIVAESDLPSLLAVNGDAQVTKFLPYETWQSLSDAHAWFQRMAGIQATGTALQFVIARRPSQEVIGSCLLFRFEEGSARAELGYVLGRAHWGQGLMSEALAALIGTAFGTMGLRRLEAEIDPRNQASIGLIQRLGFTREGLLRQRWVAKGETKDVEMFGLLNHEWRGLRSGAPPFARADSLKR